MKLTLYSVDSSNDSKVLKPRFAASSSAFLKLNGRKLLLVGQSNSPTSGIEFSADQTSVAVKLPIGIQSVLLGEPASEITNDVREIELDKIVQQDEGTGIRGLLPKVKYLIWKKAASDNNLSLIDKLLQETLRRSLWTVSELAAISGYSTRHLHRMFLKYTGFATKEFLEILRFEETLTGNSWRSAGDDIAPTDPQHRFYDQSHYIRNYKRYSGETPGQTKRRMSVLYNTSGNPPFIMSLL